MATRAFYAAGMTMYDVLGSAKSGGRHRQLSTPAALEYAPNLRRDGLRGGLVYHDAVEDDARYTLAVLRTALAVAPDAALAVTRVRATGPLRDGDRIVGARLEDRETGRNVRGTRDRRARRDGRLGRAARTVRSARAASASCRRAAATSSSPASGSRRAAG